MDIYFIHIGKVCGSTVRKYLRPTNKCHLQKPREDLLERCDKVLLGLRHPIERFVSAFNYAYSVINFDVGGLDVKDLSLENVPAPFHIKKKIERGYAYNREFNELMNYFGTANNLAESISSVDPNVRNKANALMKNPTEHIYKSIGFYCSNGQLIRKYKSKLLIYTCENLNQDLIRIAERIGVSVGSEPRVIRKGSMKKDALSPLAISNLRDFYWDSDYQTITTCYEEELLSEQMYQYYLS